MRALLLLALTGCTGPLPFVDSPPADGMRAEIVAFHASSGLSLFAYSREEPFAIHRAHEPGIVIESLLYSESLAELDLAEGELIRETGASRGLPRPARIFERNIDAQTWTARDRLSGDVASFRIAGTCGILDTILEPFAAEAIAVPASVDGGDAEVRFHRIELIDEDSLFGVTDQALYLIRRGEPYSPTPATRFAPGYPLRSFAFDRGRNKIWVVGGTVITELAFDGSALTATSTATDCYPPQVLEEVVIDDVGRPVVSTNRGNVCRLERGVFIRLRSMNLLLGAADVLSMVRTVDPANPFLASSASRLHLYDPEEDFWNLGTGVGNLAPPYYPYALASSSYGGAMENWAAGSEARVFRQLEAPDWQPWPIQFPPDYAPCTSGEYPNLTDDDAIRAIHPIEDRVLLALDFCTALVELDPTGRCSMLATPEGSVAVEGGAFETIDSRGSTVVAGGAGGLLYAARRR